MLADTRSEVAEPVDRANQDISPLTFLETTISPSVSYPFAHGGLQAISPPKHSPPVLTSPVIALALTSQNLIVPSAPRLASSASCSRFHTTFSVPVNRPVAFAAPCLPLKLEADDVVAEDVVGGLSSVEYLTLVFSGFQTLRTRVSAVARREPVGDHAMSRKPKGGFFPSTALRFESPVGLAVEDGPRAPVV